MNGMMAAGAALEVLKAMDMTIERRDGVLSTRVSGRVDGANAVISA